MSVRQTPKLALGGLLLLATVVAIGCTDHAAVTKPRTIMPADAQRNIIASEAPVVVCKKGPAGQIFLFDYSAATAPTPTTGTVSITAIDLNNHRCVEPIWKGANGMVDVTITEQAHPGTHITKIELWILDANGVPVSVTQLGTGPSVTVAPTANRSTFVIYTNEENPPVAKIGDFVWHDLNANGIQDAGEAGIAGVTLNLSQGGTVIASTTTDANGKYLFENLAAGCYDVAMVAPAGWVASPSLQGGDNAVDSNGNPTTNICVTAGESNLTIDFGLYKLAKIGDFVWSDLNNNGIQDAGEPGISGVLLTLSGGGSGTATTDGLGKYLFDNLAPGCYTVAVTAPTGFIASPVEQGSDNAVDSNGNPTTNICVGSGGSNLTIDFGFVAVCTDPTALNYNQVGVCQYPPVGGTRTIGYWKNWSSCGQSNGGQYDRALAAGNLKATLDGNIGNSAIYPFGVIQPTMTCLQAVRLLDKRSFDGTNRASDAAYNMAAQLLGAQLNRAAGVSSCPAADAAITAGRALLASIGFSGTGSFLAKGANATLISQANTLASTLTSYNEGTLGGGCPTHAQ